MKQEDKQLVAENLKRFRSANEDKKLVENLVKELQEQEKATFPARLEAIEKEQNKLKEEHKQTQYLRFGDFLLIKNKKLNVSVAFKLSNSIYVNQGPKDNIKYIGLPVEYIYATTISQAQEYLKNGWIVDSNYNHYDTRYENYSVRFVRKSVSRSAGWHGSSYETERSSYKMAVPINPTMDAIVFGKDSTWHVPNGMGQETLETIMRVIKEGYDEWYRSTI